MRWPWLLATVIALAGCTTLRTTSDTPKLSTAQPWVLLPMENLAQAPQAAERVERIAAALLRARGIRVQDYPRDTDTSPLLLTNDVARYQKALSWARQQDATYGVTGSVNEWRYKAGLDGEPAVGVTLRVVELNTGSVVWTATGARAGWGREAVSMTAQKVLDDLIDDIPAGQD